MMGSGLRLHPTLSQWPVLPQLVAGFTSKPASTKGNFPETPEDRLAPKVKPSRLGSPRLGLAVQGLQEGFEGKADYDSEMTIGSRSKRRMPDFQRRLLRQGHGRGAGIARPNRLAMRQNYVQRTTFS
jgi:hypothetical protein